MGRTKLIAAVVFVMIYIAGIAGYTVYSYHTYKEELMEEIDNKLAGVAALAQESIGENYHATLSTINEQKYLEVCAKISDLATKLDVKYIYTMIEKGGKIYFTSSSYTPEELKEKSYTKLMDFYEEASPQIAYALNSGEVRYDESTDRWGTFRSVYIPISTPHGEKFAIGVDIDIDVIEAHKTKILEQSIMTALFFLLLILPALIIYLIAMKKEKQELEDIIDEKTAELREFNKDLKELSMQLAKYLSPQIYTMLFQKKSEAKIGTKRKRLTVFFSDIKGFTSITETLEPEDLTFLLNSYLNEMSSVALEFGATIDKFVGDAILIFFGDPESKGDQEDALLCIQMAATMQDRLTVLREMWYERGIKHVFEVRMGVATGYCTVGNFGSETRMDYTIIGNTVNLASRLESSAPAGGILISEETYLLIKDTYKCEVREKIDVKGFKEPVQTYFVDYKTQKRIVKKEGEGYSLRIDMDAMSPEDVKKLIQSISDAAQSQGLTPNT